MVILANHIQPGDIPWIVSDDQRLPWLGDHRQNVRPITDAFKMQSVSLQATSRYRQEADQERLRMGRYNRGDPRRQAVVPGGGRRRTQHPMFMMVVLADLKREPSGKLR